MPYARTLRVDLNQPFEFQEALLSAAERSRLQRAGTAQQLFEAEPQRLRIKEFSLRAISIRLRTINNAYDSGVSLPDGIPLTEVSIYGSRDRHFVLGPYSAVMRLMSGVLPDRRPYRGSDDRGRDARNHLDAALRTLREYVAQVGNGSRVQRLHLDSLMPKGAVAGPFGRMVQLATEDLGFLRAAVLRLEALKLEIPQAPASPLPPAHWWEEIPPFTGMDEHKRLIEDVMGKAREVLCELESQVFAPE